MVNIHIKDLSIELTRWCQQQCMHCMRGPRENLFISKEVIDKFFNNSNYKIKYINKLLLTGGEPTLAAKELKYLVDVIESLGIVVDKYLILTNGLSYNDLFFEQLKRIDKMNGYTRKSSIIISTDPFHKKPSEEVLKKIFNIGGESQEEDIKEIVNVGLARINNIGNLDMDFIPLYLEFLKGIWIYSDKIKKIKYLTKNKDEIIFSGMEGFDISDNCICLFPETLENYKLKKHLAISSISLNANGYITCNPNGEFKLQDQYNLGNILDTPLLSMYEDLKLDINDQKIKNLLFSSTIPTSKEILR